MMRYLFAALAVTVTFLSAPVRADPAGEFDYYVLSLSWSPNWCRTEGDAKGSDQCDARHDFGWTLHGLWPQNAAGYPQDCTSRQSDPTRRQSDAMSDIMGSGGLAWYQWKKHGRCSGLSGTDYYALARRAYDSIQRPPVLRKLDHSVKLPAHVVEEAFLEVNPGLSPDMLTITCQGGYIQEARLCLTRDLQPRVCGADVRRDCALDAAILEPVR